MVPSSLACQLLGRQELTEGMHGYKVVMRLSLKVHGAHVQDRMLIFFSFKKIIIFSTKETACFLAVT